MGQWISQTRKFNKHYANVKGGVIPPIPGDAGFPSYKLNGYCIPFMYGINGCTFPYPTSSDYKVTKSMSGSIIDKKRLSAPSGRTYTFSITDLGDHATEPSHIDTENPSGLTYACPRLHVYKIGIALTNDYDRDHGDLPSDLQRNSIDDDFSNVVISNSLFTMQMSDMLSSFEADILDWLQAPDLTSYPQSWTLLFKPITDSIVSSLGRKINVSRETYNGTLKINPNTGDYFGPEGYQEYAFYTDTAGAKNNLTGGSARRDDTTNFSDGFPEHSTYRYFTPGVCSPELVNPARMSSWNDYLDEFSQSHSSLSGNVLKRQAFFNAYVPGGLYASKSYTYDASKVESLIQGLYTPYISDLHLFIIPNKRIPCTVQKPKNGVYYTYINIVKISGVDII